jgi:hypothetical protein
MTTPWIEPRDQQGQAELTVVTGLEITSQDLWTLSLAGYNDGATFGLSLTHPRPEAGGELRVRAQGWPIAHIGNQLVSYTDPDTGVTYGADRCEIRVTGQWQIIRAENSNSFVSFGIIHGGVTDTDQGSRDYWGTLYTPRQTFRIAGAAVPGGAADTFTDHVFRVRATETATSDNSNRLFQSNTILRPAWVYSYLRRWYTA